MILSSKKKLSNVHFSVCYGKVICNKVNRNTYGHLISMV